MRRCRRVRNRGGLHRADLSLLLSARASVSGLTRRGILVSQRARVHTFGARLSLRYRRGAISAITRNSFSGRTPALPGDIYKCGLSFMKRAFKCPEWETLTPLLTTLKRNTSLRRSSLVRFAGISNSSATLVMATDKALAGVQTLPESISL